MDELLERKIKNAYSDGTIYSLNKEYIENEKRDKRLKYALKYLHQECGVEVKLSSSGNSCPKCHFHITSSSEPRFDSWIWSMSNKDKIAWICENGEPYCVLWLDISKVADYYCIYVNHWTQRGHTDYLDVDCRLAPNRKWTQICTILKQQLEVHGFKECDDKIGRERLAFLLEQDYDSIPDDDPRWDEDDFEPPFTPAMVYTALFGEQ